MRHPAPLSMQRFLPGALSGGVAGMRPASLPAGASSRLGLTMRVSAQEPANEALSGRELYRVAYVACRGSDGIGTPSSTLEFDLRRPDFTDYACAVPEPDSNPFLPGIGDALGPLPIDIGRRYQPTGFRWAANIERDGAEEPRRFTSLYNALAHDSSAMHARLAARVP